MSSKLISIIIPQYKEDERIINPLLSTLDSQMGINFDDIEILIVNDYSDVILSDNYLRAFYNIKPQYLKLKKNVGLGMCRQAGLNKAQGEYVMFCDSDDRFCSVIALRRYIDMIKKHTPDIIVSSFYEEIKVDGIFYYKEHPEGYTWVHGKMYRREYLIENEIRFHPKFRVQEDTYFNGLALELTTNRMLLPFVTYVWCYNPQSFTRVNDGEFSYKAYPVFIESASEMFRILRGKKPDLLPYKVTQFLIYTFFQLHLAYWEKEEAEPHRDKVYSMLEEFYDEFSFYLNIYGDKQKREVIDKEWGKVMGTTPYNLQDTFEDFIKNIQTQKV